MLKQLDMHCKTIADISAPLTGAMNCSVELVDGWLDALSVSVNLDTARKFVIGKKYRVTIEEVVE